MRSSDALVRPIFSVSLAADTTPVTGTGINAWSDVAGATTGTALSQIVQDTHGLLVTPGDGGGATFLEIQTEKWEGFWRFIARVQAFGWSATPAADFMIPAIALDLGGGFPGTPQLWGDYETNPSSNLGALVSTKPVELVIGEKAKPMWFHDAAGSVLTMDAVSAGAVLTFFGGWYMGKDAGVGQFGN